MDQPAKNQTSLRSFRSEKAKLIPRDISDNLGKLPPQATDLEETILAAIMLEKNAMMDIATFLRPEHFYTEQHKEIYTAIQLLFAAGQPVDLRTVVNELRKLGKLEVVGGHYAITLISDKASSSANLEAHARILVEYAMKRSMIQLSSQIQQDAYDDTQDVFSLIDKVNLELQEILDDAVGSKTAMTMKDYAVKVVQDVQARQSGQHTGLDSGYEVLDALLNGFTPTDLIIVAARPGMGKTAFVVQAAKQIAERGIPVGIISLEMSGNQLVERLATAESEIEADKIKKGVLNELEHSLFIEAAGKLASLPIFIEDVPFITILELRARAMRMITKHGIKFLAIDYLQLIKGSGRAGQNRDQEISEITRTLKGMAKELGIPIVALSQLNRGLETRGGSKRPQLSDLRESGAIEQDADVVMFLYRPEYYKITVDENGFPTHGMAEVIVAKHRAGALDTILLKFVGKYTKFKEWTMEMGRVDQTEYRAKHYKSVENPEDRALPSATDIKDFNADEQPF